MLQNRQADFLSKRYYEPMTVDRFRDIKVSTDEQRADPRWSVNMGNIREDHENKDHPRYGGVMGILEATLPTANEMRDSKIRAKEADAKRTEEQQGKH